MNKWLPASTPPTEDGYYLTVHYYQQTRDHLWKPFWYRVDKAEWIFRYKPIVKIWYNKRFDFYAPCSMQGKTRAIPKKLLPLLSNPSLYGPVINK